MKKLFKSLIFLFSIFILFSCKNLFEFSSRTSKISITLPFEQSRAIWAKDDITKYTIVLTCASTSDFKITETATPENPAVTFNELLPDEYTIEVTAYNEETEIAYGKTKVDLQAGQTATPTIKLSGYDTKPDAPIPDDPIPEEKNPFFANTLEETKFYDVKLLGKENTFLNYKTPLTENSYYQLKHSEKYKDDESIYFDVLLCEPEKEPQNVDTAILVVVSKNFLVFNNTNNDNVIFFTEYGSEQNITIEQLLEMSKEEIFDYETPYSYDFTNKIIPKTYSNLYKAFKDEETIPSLKELTAEQLIKSEIGKIKIQSNIKNNPYIFYAPANESISLPDYSFYTRNTESYDVSKFATYSNKECTEIITGTYTVKAGETTLYAQFPESTRKLIYNSNYPDSGLAPASFTYNINSSIPVPFYENAITYDNTYMCFNDGEDEEWKRKINNDPTEAYLFCGWSVNTQIPVLTEENYNDNKNLILETPVLQPGDEYKITEDTNLYAVWLDTDVNNYCFRIKYYFGREAKTSRYHINYLIDKYRTDNGTDYDAYNFNINLPIIENMGYPYLSQVEKYATQGNNWIFFTPDTGYDFDNPHSENSVFNYNVSSGSKEFKFIYDFEIPAVIYNGLESGKTVEQYLYSYPINSITLLPFGSLSSDLGYDDSVEFKQWKNIKTEATYSDGASIAYINVDNLPYRLSAEVKELEE